MKRILAADDNPAILDALKIMLEDVGYSVETTEDGAVAQYLKPPYPDLLLLDVWMSGVDGRDVCKYLKSKAETKHIPIIMISATKDIIHITQKAGADDYISKPFQMDHLLAVVEKHLGRNTIIH
ncbi:MAG: hypothetical protein NVS1B7_4810 [Candidatus Saccharimonadales bacterium]